jgi:amino-acid N-acetyltransferase
MMIFQNLALKKGKQVVGHNVSPQCTERWEDLWLEEIQSWAKLRRPCESTQDNYARCYGTERALSNQLREELAKEHVKDLSNQQKAKKEARAHDKVRLV